MRTTDELLSALKFPNLDIEEYLETYQDDFVDIDIPSVWKTLIRKSGMKNAEIINASDFDPVYFYEIISNKKKPSRDKILRLLLGMGATFEDCQFALKSCGFPLLYPRDRRDSLLIYCINNYISVNDTNILLSDKGVEPLK